MRRRRDMLCRRGSRCASASGSRSSWSGEHDRSLCLRRGRRRPSNPAGRSKVPSQARSQSSHSASTPKASPMRCIRSASTVVHGELAGRAGRAARFGQPPAAIVVVVESSSMPVNVIAAPADFALSGSTRSTREYRVRSLLLRGLDQFAGRDESGVAIDSFVGLPVQGADSLQHQRLGHGDPAMWAASARPAVGSSGVPRGPADVLWRPVAGSVLGSVGTGR